MLDRLLDESRRVRLAALLVAVLAAMGWDFGHRMDAQKVRYRDAARAPEAFRDRDVTISYSRVSRVETERFFLRYRGRDVEVIGSLPGLAPRAITSVRGRILPDRRLILQRGHVHKGRELKWYAAVVTLLGCFLVLAREMRREARRA